MKDVVLASNNKHKIVEFKNIMRDYNILSLNDIGFFKDIVEDGDTLLENALIKAREVSLFLRDKNMHYDVIADDSGLFVPSLLGEPGVHSARYALDHNDKKNRDKLREKIKGKDRRAYFMCQLVYYREDDTYLECNGKVFGRIIDEERGKTDFGYDSIFYSDELSKTFGEADDNEKNSVSHRGRAICELLKLLQ